MGPKVARAGSGGLAGGHEAASHRARRPFQHYGGNAREKHPIAGRHPNCCKAFKLAMA